MWSVNADCGLLFGNVNESVTTIVPLFSNPKGPVIIYVGGGGGGGDFFCFSMKEKT